MLPCHCKLKIYFRFFEVCTYPSIHNFVIEPSPCNAISEGRPLLSNTSSEAGALPLEVRIKNDWDQIFSKSKFVHSFLETNFLHVLNVKSIKVTNGESKDNIPLQKIAVPVWYRPNLPVPNRNRYQPKFHRIGYRSGPEPEFRSGPKINPINKFII